MYWTSWPENAAAVAVQLDKIIVNGQGGIHVVVYWTGPSIMQGT